MFFKPAFAALLAVVPFLVQAQVQQWGQCGGNGYNGSKTCVSGSYCKFTNDWYSQCVPGTDPNGGTPPQPTSTYTPPVVTTPAVTPTSTVDNPGPTTTPTNPTNPGTCPAIPANINLVANSKLPDPFKKIDGSRVTTKADWECRRKEILALFQRYELGTFPPKPQSVTGTRSGNSLSINVSEAGKSISFSVSISYPSGTGPFPAIIAYGALSLPAQSGVATITFNNDDIGTQQNSGSRGRGKFYDLYGSGHSASATTAWAWGVDRIMDALETTANINIDPKRVAVTGCSRNGKGAIIAGALVDRIALTIPQESGSGGSACWRLSDAQKKNGQNVQTASQIITENVWFSKEFEKYVNNVNQLPIDHHMLAGLIAPRGLYVADNTDMEWLGQMSSYGCMFTGQKIFEALGVKDNMGYSQIGGHSHCSFPSGQNSELQAFVNKFLKNQSANTAVMRTTKNPSGFTESQWVDWTVPSLT